MSQEKLRKISIVAKALLYFILVLFISSYFELDNIDMKYTCLLDNIYIAVIFSVLAVFIESKFQK